ncbi:MAG: hypothetical protein HYT61_02975 [Candidatus Yanofskybacteria bacterium]|nr:hypothetical protein [Candidatus Yanofskybacteria bacterium]
MYPEFQLIHREYGRVGGGSDSKAEFPLSSLKIEKGGWFTYASLKLRGVNGEEFDVSFYECCAPERFKFEVDNSKKHITVLIFLRVIVVAPEDGTRSFDIKFVGPDDKIRSLKRKIYESQGFVFVD